MREHIVMSQTPARMAMPVRVRLMKRCSPNMASSAKRKAPPSRRLTLLPQRVTTCLPKNSGKA